jgi:hypothetical protein
LGATNKTTLACASFSGSVVCVVALSELTFWAIADDVGTTICDKPEVTRKASPSDIRKNVVGDDIGFSFTIYTSYKSLGSAKFDAKYIK